MLLSKSTTSDLTKMGSKLEEFFSQQFHSSRRVFSSLRLAGPRRAPRGSGRDGEEAPTRLSHQRHWQGALALVSGLQLGWGLKLPLHGTLVGGSMDLQVSKLLGR